jgi:hypothetical protein
MVFGCAFQHARAQKTNRKQYVHLSPNGNVEKLCDHVVENFGVLRSQSRGPSIDVE